MPQLPSAFSSPLQTGSALHEPVAASPLRSASAPARPPSTLRMLLKVQTADVHARLERDTRLNRLIVARPATTGSPLTQAICAAQYRATYVSFLLVAHALERGFEHALAGPHIARWFAEQGMNSESPSGSVRAKADLAALGVSADLDSHPPAPLSHPTSPAEALAIFYVREGSRFGGAMIGKCVEMWLGKDAPRTFLTPYGKNVKPTIEAAFECFEKNRSASTDLDAVRAARRLFAEIRLWQLSVEREMLGKHSLFTAIRDASIPKLLGSLGRWITHR